MMLAGACLATISQNMQVSWDFTVKAQLLGVDLGSYELRLVTKFA
jgi:hypothetical protein